MSEYRLTEGDAVDVIEPDGSYRSIPADPNNADRAEYERLKAKGYKPLAAIKRDKPDELAGLDGGVMRLMLDLQNQVRALRNEAPITMAEYRTAAKPIVKRPDREPAKA